MTKENDRKSMSLRMPIDLDEYFEQEASRIGIPKHSLIIMTLQNSRETRESSKVLA